MPKVRRAGKARVNAAANRHNTHNLETYKTETVADFVSINILTSGLY